MWYPVNAVKTECQRQFNSVLVPKIYYLGLLMRKTPDKPKLRSIPMYSMKLSRSWKINRKTITDLKRQT